MEGQLQAEGIASWFRQRRRSWASRQRGLLLAAFWLLGSSILVIMLPVAVELLLPHGGPLHSTAFRSIQRVLASLGSLSVLALYFLLAGSCISYCLPGSDMLGGLGNREFYLALRRESLAIGHRMALQLVLPVLLAGSISEALVLMRFGMFEPLRAVPRSLVPVLLALIHSVICVQLSLRLPGMAAALRMWLGLMGVLLCLMTSSAPLFLVYMATDNFSNLSDNQIQLLLGSVPLAMMALVLWGLLAWSRLQPPDLITELERFSTARKG